MVFGYLACAVQIQFTASPVFQAGNIAVLTGLKSTRTGDTLLKSGHFLKQGRKIIQKFAKKEKSRSHAETVNDAEEDTFREVSSALLVY